jgi:membrane-associated phospholipid phosphatase
VVTGGPRRAVRRQQCEADQKAHRPEPPGLVAFPSSHVAGHAAVLASLWCLAPRTRAWRGALIVASGVTATIGAERICAGRHWPSDVVVGAAFGIGVGLALGKMARRADSVRGEAAIPDEAR